MLIITGSGSGAGVVASTAGSRLPLAEPVACPGSAASISQILAVSARFAPTWRMKLSSPSARRDELDSALGLDLAVAGMDRARQDLGDGVSAQPPGPKLEWPPSMMKPAPFFTASTRSCAASASDNRPAGR